MVYRTDPFRDIIAIHFKKGEPPQGSGYPGIIIYVNPWVEGAGPWRNTSYMDFVLVINSTGPFASGNPIYNGSGDPGKVDAGRLLPQSATTYYSMSIAVASWAGDPDPEGVAAAIAYDWYIIGQRIEYLKSIASESDRNALGQYIDDAFTAAKNTYDDYVQINGTGQYQSDINYLADPLPM